MTRCPTCNSDDRADRRVIETLPPTDRFVDPYLCDDAFHEPPDLYDPGEPRPTAQTEIVGWAYTDCLDTAAKSPGWPIHVHTDNSDTADTSAISSDMERVRIIREPRPDPTRYAEWRKGGAGWGGR